MRYHPQAMPPGADVTRLSNMKSEPYLRTLWNRSINKSVKKSVLDRSMQQQRILDDFLREKHSSTTTVTASSSTLPSTSTSTTPPPQKKAKNTHQTLPPLPSSQFITAEVKGKMLADMVEALVGAYYLSGGIVLALELLRGLDIWPERNQRLSEISSTMVDIVTDMSLTLSMTPQEIEDVGNIFHYSFRNPLLLQEALTYSSASTGEASYQRLEFLGDGVLDLVSG
jgi:dsRNA-specific ribonuclease